jgi:hypothetical protein
MKESRHLQVSMLFSPTLPAREVAVAYLSTCGFVMFEVLDERLVAYAIDVDLNEQD